MRNGGGVIVNMAWIVGGHMTVPGLGAGLPAKAAVRALTGTGVLWPASPESGFAAGHDLLFDAGGTA